MLVFLYIDIYS